VATVSNGSSGGRRLAPPDNNRQRWLQRRRTSRARLSRRRIRFLVTQVLIVILALVAWQWVSGGKTQRLTVSQPTEVWKWFSEWVVGGGAHALSDLWVTLEDAFDGWVLGIVIGVALAVPLATSKWNRLFTAPFVSVLNARPQTALAPLFILISGANMKSKVYFITAAIFFTDFYNVFGGIRSIDQGLLPNARVLGASRL
jgi:NitT/TauT family transport system permease protein